MSEISVIGNAVVGTVRSTAPTAPAKPVEVIDTTATSEITATATDQVEFSEQAQLLEKIHDLPSVRQDKIDAIKDAIASNAYLTNDKLDVAFDRLIEEVR